MVVYFAIGSFFTFLGAIGVALWLDYIAKGGNKQKTYEGSDCNQGVS